MAAKVEILTPEGKRRYSVYNDNREVVKDFAAGALAAGEEILYRGLICEVYGEFTDCDGERYAEMIVLGNLGPQIQFSVC